MPTTNGSTTRRATRAEEKVLGTKFCFSCQKHRALENGKHVMRGKTKAWRCLDCSNKLSPMGFKK